MVSQAAFRMEFDLGRSKPVVVEPSTAQISTDGGMIPLRQFDEQIGLTKQFAEALIDERDPARIEHTFLEMSRMRIYGILGDYPDQNDHDVLRSDPIFKIICDRSIQQSDLASQPTLSRFENSIGTRSMFQLREVFLHQFIASFESPPSQLTLDIDPFDVATHGQQQLTFFHGYYGQYQYLPRLVTCADNDMIVDLCLLYGTAHPTLGANTDLTYVIRRLQEAWPGVRIHLRADSGFGVPKMYECCEQLEVDYTIGIGMNRRLKSLSESCLEEAVSRLEDSGESQRLFCAFWYRADGWPAQRWVIVKCEANGQGTNRRAIITNRPGAHVMPAATYDEYADRGESENRNKEMKCGLQADRLSDHRYFANLFRLYLHAAAHNLLIRLRREIACPPAPVSDQDIPEEALAGRDRRRHHNRRREADPLGEGHPCTWRTRLIKVAACVHETTRRVVVQLSSSWPYLDHYREISAQLLARNSTVPNTG